MRRNLKRQAGQGMTEYIIVVALVAVAAIAVYQYFGQVVRAQVAAMAHELSGEDGSASLRAGGRPRRRQRAKPGRVTQGLWRQRGGRQVMARHGHASAQRGQALVAGLVLLAGAVAALVAMHRLGRIIEQRVRLTHAVDAAAYSARCCRRATSMPSPMPIAVRSRIRLRWRTWSRWPRRRATSIARRRRPDAATRLPVCWVICSAPAPGRLIATCKACPAPGPAWRMRWRGTTPSCMACWRMWRRPRPAT